MLLDYYIDFVEYIEYLYVYLFINCRFVVLWGVN